MAGKIESLIQLRHYLHANPEKSGKEVNTQKIILEYFSSIRPDKIRKIAKTGLIFTFKGKKSARNVLLRTEMDALPIQETNVFDYHSVRKGISHKCGHDGHMAILAGMGDWCSNHKLENTDVHLLFQPAEETGEGARKVMEDPEFDLNPDFCFAIHNIPGFNNNEILIRKNHFSASVISIAIKLNGKIAHAAEPESGLNPALAVAEIITVFDKLNNNTPGTDNFFMSTPIFIILGEEGFGTSAGKARLGFTFRCWNNELMKEMQASVKEILQEVAEINGLELGYRWVEEFYANYNHEGAVNLAVRSADNLKYPVRYLDLPFKWGEDFGFFTSQFNGAMIGIGAGINTPSLHHQNYDFPDELIETGLNLFQEIIIQYDKE